MLFFTLAMAFLVKKRYNAFYALFPIATLNRETTILLTIFFVIYEYKRMPRIHWLLGIMYQVIAYVSIRALTLWVYRDRAGTLIWLTFDQIIQSYLSQPVLVSVLLLLTFTWLFFVFHGWSNKPKFLRYAFLCIFPLQVLLHLLFGLPFEIRVFVESVPVITCLIAYHPPSENAAISATALLLEKEAWQ